MDHFNNFKSSNVKSLGYSEADGELTVEFQNGSRYAYIGVTPLRWQSLKEAESVGSFVQSKIIGRCEGRKLE